MGEASVPNIDTQRKEKTTHFPASASHSSPHLSLPLSLLKFRPERGLKLEPEAFPLPLPFPALISPA